MKFFSLIIINIFLFLSSIYCQNDASYYYNKANASRDSKNFQDAITNCKKALELYPDSMQEQISLTYWNLTYCYYELGDFSNAKDACYAWINKGSFFLGDACFSLGTIYTARKEYYLAILSYSNAIQYSSDFAKSSSYTVVDCYDKISQCYKQVNNKYGWVPESEYWKVKIPSASWNYQKNGKTSCISSFSVRVENKLPITIKAVNIDLIIKDKKGTIVYKKNHTAWINDLNPTEIAQSEYFDLTNEVCLPTNYVDSEKFFWTSVITGVAY